MMSLAGNPWAKTPHMDSIAAGGVYFTQSYCPYPLCSPSRSSLHTSRTPHENRVDTNGVPIDPAMPVSGQAFVTAGYNTGYAGKWHLPVSFPTAGIAGYEVLNKVAAQSWNRTGPPDRQTDRPARRWLSQRKHDKPFLLVASFLNPHDICMLAAETRAVCPQRCGRSMVRPPDARLPPLPANFPLTVGEPARLADARGTRNGTSTNGGAIVTHISACWRTWTARWGACSEALRQSGQEENTLIVFTSDHGEGLGLAPLDGQAEFLRGRSGRAPGGQLEGRCAGGADRPRAPASRRWTSCRRSATMRASRARRSCAARACGPSSTSRLSRAARSSFRRWP